jgi:integrase
MAKYKKRKDGRYGTKVNLGKAPDGKYIRIPVYARTIAELEEKIREVKNQSEQGVDLTKHKPTVEAWAEKWLAVYKKDIKRSMRATYQSNIDKWLKPILSLRIDKVKQIQVQEIIADAVDELAQSSMDKLYNCIRGIFSSARANGLTAVDVTEKIEKPHGLRKTKRTGLTSAEKTILERACWNNDNGKLPMICTYAGLRLNEALALTWGDIGDKYITVNKTIVYEENANKASIKDSPKSNAGFRDVPILPPLEPFIVRPRDAMDSALVFGKLYSKTMQRHMWKSLMKSYSAEWAKEYEPKEGEPLSIVPPLKRKITCHMLRHTYATILYEAGVDVKTAQRWLGHATIAMTMDIYTELSKEKEGEAVDKLRAHFSDDKSDDTKVTDDNLTTQKILNFGAK